MNFKKSNRLSKLASIFICILMVMMNGPIYANAEDSQPEVEMTNTVESPDEANDSEPVEQIPLEGIKDELLLNDEVMPDEVKQELSDVEKNISEDTDILESEKPSDIYDSAEQTPRAPKPRPEDFGIFPDIKVERLTDNISYGDVFYHTLTGLDITYPEGDYAPSNGHGIELRNTNGFDFLKTMNYEFQGIIIPESYMSMVDGTVVRTRLYSILTFIDSTTGKNHYSYETYNIEPGARFELTKSDLDALALEKGLTDYVVDFVHINIGSDQVIDWSSNKDKLPGVFHKSEFPQGILVGWKYGKNANRSSVSNYDNIYYNHRFASKVGGTTAAGYYEDDAAGWIFTLTSDAQLKSPDQVAPIKIGEEFEYTATIKNDSNIGNLARLYFPVTKGVTMTNILDQDMSWEKRNTAYVGDIATTIRPGETFSTTIKLVIDETYEGNTFELNLIWGSAYADYANARQFGENILLNIDRGQSIVTFNTNGGSEISEVVVTNSDYLVQPQNPVKEGYDFSGWFKDSALTEEWIFEDDVVTSDITLYAQWIAQEVDPSLSVEKNTVTYYVNDTISEAKFLTDINAQLIGDGKIVSSFLEVDFSTIGEYNVVLSISTRAVVKEINVTVSIIPHDPSIPSEEPNTPNDPSTPSEEPNIPNVIPEPTEEPNTPIDVSEPTKEPEFPEQSSQSNDTQLPATGVQSSMLANTLIVSGFVLLLSQKRRKRELKQKKI